MYLVRGEEAGRAEAALAGAASGRVLRCARAFSGSPEEALSEASSGAGAIIRGSALDRSPLEPGSRGYVVSIRREDRERFEETSGAASARWIGETIAEPGWRLEP